MAEEAGDRPDEGGDSTSTPTLPTAEGETLNADCTPRVCINIGCGNYTTARSRGCRACAIRGAQAAVMSYMGRRRT